jgi:hypothetical protein
VPRRQQRCASHRRCKPPPLTERSSAFIGETEAVLHDAILNREPTPLRELAPELMPQMAAIISIYVFEGGGNGQEPSQGNPVFDPAGHIYGETWMGGGNDAGIVYQLMHHSTGWAESVLYAFNDPNYGAYQGDAFLHP